MYKRAVTREQKKLPIYCHVLLSSKSFSFIFQNTSWKYNNWTNVFGWKARCRRRHWTIFYCFPYFFDCSILELCLWAHLTRNIAILQICRGVLSPAPQGPIAHLHRLGAGVGVHRARAGDLGAAERAQIYGDSNCGRHKTDGGQQQQQPVGLFHRQRHNIHHGRDRPQVPQDLNFYSAIFCSRGL